MDYIEKFNIIMLGDQGVGKSSIMTNYLNNKLYSQMETTIGVDFGAKIIELKNKEKIKLHIWDTAGHERFRAITTSYLNKADSIILVYDLNKYESFKNLEIWIGTIDKYCKRNIPIFLIGNKNDLLNTIKFKNIKQDNKFLNIENLIEYYELNIYNLDKINKLYLQISEYLFEQKLLLEMSEKNKNPKDTNIEINNDFKYKFKKKFRNFCSF